MAPLNTPAGTWSRELQRSRQSLCAVNQFWQGLYGKAVLDPDAASLLVPTGPSGRSEPSNAPPGSGRSMYERVGSRAMDR
jgi:hypothetical protein